MQGTSGGNVNAENRKVNKTLLTLVYCLSVYLHLHLSICQAVSSSFHRNGGTYRHAISMKESNCELTWMPRMTYYTLSFRVASSIYASLCSDVQSGAVYGSSAQSRHPLAIKCRMPFISVSSVRLGENRGREITQIKEIQFLFMLIYSNNNKKNNKIKWMKVTKMLWNKKY